MTVTAKINNIDNVLNDLTKSQCNDGQVIAFQSQNRNTDQKTKDTCKYSTHKNCQEKSEPCRLDHTIGKL